MIKSKLAKFSNKRTLTIITIGVSSIIIGIVLARVTVFEVFKFALLWSVVALITIVIAIFDGIYKKRNFRIPGLVLAALTLAFIVSLPIRIHYNTEKRNKSEIAIKELTHVKEQKGNYPTSLVALELDIDFSEINYSTDSLKQVFYISYSVDGWHNERYNSNDRKWTGGD